MNINDLKVDSKKIEEGGWIGAGHGTPIPEWDDLALKVRGPDCGLARDLRAALVASVPHTQKHGGRLSDAVAQDISTEVLVKTVLLDWSNLRRDGVEVPYTKETAKEILSDPDYRLFRLAVMWASERIAAPVGRAAA